MTLDLERHLRDYVDVLDATLPEIAAEQITSRRIGTGPVRPVVVRHPRRRFRVGWAIGAAVLAVALLLPFAFINQGTEQDVATTTTAAGETTTTTVAPTTTTVPDQPPATIDDTTDVVGLDANDASAALQQAGYRVRRVDSFVRDVPAGTVVEVEPIGRPDPNVVVTLFVAARTGVALDPGPYAGWTWTEVEVAPRGFEPTHPPAPQSESDLGFVDGLYFILDGSSARIEWNPDETPVPTDLESFIWVSADGAEWTRFPLPDVVERPANWSFNPRTGAVVAHNGGDSVTLRPVATNGRLEFEPFEGESRPEVAVPDMPALGLEPFGGLTGDVASLGDTAIGVGDLGFQIPGDVRADLQGLFDGGWDGDGLTFHSRDESGRVVATSRWSVEGARVTVEITDTSGDEPVVVYTAWGEFPAGFELGSGPSDGEYASPFLFAQAPALWLSRAGEPFTPMPTERSDEVSWGTKVIAHRGQLLRFGYADPGNASGVNIWSWQDDGWIRETTNAGNFDTHSIAHHDGALFASRHGLWRSEDGIEWESLGGGFDGTEPADLTDFGFTHVDTRANSVNVSVDGVEWFGIPLPDYVRGLISELYTVFFVGDLAVVRTFTGGTVDPGPNAPDLRMWVGRLP